MATSKYKEPMAHSLKISLPMPNSDGLSVWIEMLENYPSDVLKRAIDVLIRRHKWNSPPSIADVIEQAEADPSYKERNELSATAFRLTSYLRIR